VTGLDATPSFLEHAETQARRHGVEVDFIRGDMCSLPFRDQRFDRVLSWFTSFGYFDDEDDRHVLADAHRVLRPRGRLLIENNNLAELLPRWLPVVVHERDGDFAIDRQLFEPSSARALTERTIVRDGHTRQFSFSVRMFIAAELRLATGRWFLERRVRRPRRRTANRSEPAHGHHRGSLSPSMNGRIELVRPKGLGAERALASADPPGYS
jgi:SAM-dependent methyltransferase